MPEKDRYGTLVDFLKILVSLSSAILVFAAALYTDQSKIPIGWPKYVLLAGVAAILGNLMLSLYSIGIVNNLIMNDAFLESTEKRQLYRKVATSSNLAYAAFALFAVLAFAFFLIRTFGLSADSTREVCL